MKKIKSMITLIVTLCILATIALPAIKVTAVTSIKIQTCHSQNASNQICPNFKIVNTDTNSIDLTKVAIRYYFTAESTTETFNFWIDDASNISSLDIVGRFGIVNNATNADRYFELTFKKGTIPPNSSVLIKSRFAKPDYSNFDQSNDYSYNKDAFENTTGYVDWEKVTAHISGALYWGKEPSALTIQNLKAVEVDAVSVKLNWTPLVTQAVDKYAVYRNDFLIGKTQSKSGYFSDFGRNPLITYTYRVSALDSSGMEIATSDSIYVKTTNEVKVKTSYKVLALTYDPVLGPNVPTKYANQTINGVNLAQHYKNNMANRRVSELRGNVVTNSDGSMPGEFNDSSKMHRYKDQFLKNAKNIYKFASNQTIDFEFYNNKVIALNEYPPANDSNFQQNDELILEMACDPQHCSNKGCSNKDHLSTMKSNIIYDVGPHGGVDYQKMVSKQYTEFGGNSIIDLVEKGEIDAVWFLGGPPLCGFAENPLLGNRNIGLDLPDHEVFRSDKSVACSRSFFFSMILCDSRTFDANIHMFEGVMSSISDANRAGTWPRNISMYVYKENTIKPPASNELELRNYNLWGRFRTADQQGCGTNDDRFAASSPGNANVGSSHFPPNSIRGIDYGWEAPETWRPGNYVSSCADDWYSYPNLPSPPVYKMIGPYDFGAYNYYEVGTSYKEMGYTPLAYHMWWLNHLPHNPGVNSNGILNNWWYYVYDFNRFNGSSITYNVTGFPTPLPTTHNPINNEYGTEQNSSRGLEWGYWHSHNISGKNATLTMINKSTTEEAQNVKYGNNSLKAEINCSKDVESGSKGRNDIFYPLSKNAGWNLAGKTSVKFSIKPGQNFNLINGTNPIIRLCMDNGNKIEYIPKNSGIYKNYLLNPNVWNDFTVPLNGDSMWESNVIGYINPNLTGSDRTNAVNALKDTIMKKVNYVEISIGSTILTTDHDNIFSIYIDGLNFN
ncbi:MAG TPA: cellulose binding domain-containing protein [Pseudobacteroides sp.]|uniref:cellulose binding domain-containing protein n=1 Tax=Pseudobacteroides sp. TaxID=1968840 RepID=UPI002F9265F2